MQKVQTFVSRFFTGVRLILPMIPEFAWIAAKSTWDSISKFWKHSQEEVESITETYWMRVTDAKEESSEYEESMYRICYSIASFFYLVCWIAQAWLTVEAFRWLLSVIP